MKIQASSVNRIYNCPGSLQIDSSIPKELRNESTSFAATFGSDIHNIAENSLRAWYEKTKIDTIRKQVQVKYKKESVEFDKGVKAATIYVSHIKKHINGVRKKKNFSLKIEEKYKFKYGRYELVAKMDCMTIYEEKDILHISIFDLETGVWDYSDSAYLQMLYTVYLVLFTDYKEYNNFKIKIHTIQPNYYVDNLKIVVDSAEFKESPVELLNTFLHSIHENVNMQPGSYCKFCPALLVCPIIQQNLFEILESQEVKNMTFEQLEELQDKAAYIKTYLKQLEEFLIENESKLKTYRVKHNAKSKRLIKVENPFEEEAKEI